FLSLKKLDVILRLIEQEKYEWDLFVSQGISVCSNVNMGTWKMGFVCVSRQPSVCSKVNTTSRVICSRVGRTTQKHQVANRTFGFFEGDVILRLIEQENMKCLWS